MAQIIMAERLAAPDTPASGKVAIYVRDGAYYTKNAAGIETPLQGINGTNGIDGVDGAAGIDTISYDNRGTLRSLESGTKIVDGLGLFQYVAGSDEPDDDESCFATTNGRWLLECVHWDVVDNWQLPDDEVRDEFDEDSEIAIATNTTAIATNTTAIATLNSRILTGTAVCSVTSLNAVTQTSFTGTITGAAIGDNVIATPANALTGRISVFARVTAANTVTVYLNNPSAASATLVAGTWSIAVIKGQ